MNKTTLKKALLFTLCILPVAVVGGYFAARYSLQLMDESILAEGIRQVGSREALVALTMVSNAVYAVVCAFFGYLLAAHLGLMRPFRLEKATALRVALISAVCAAVFSLDQWTFGRWAPQLVDYYRDMKGFDLDTWAASILYGGVIEEVMLRLFVMSLLALLGWKLFFRKEPRVPARALIAANILCALLFAAGHLPSTAQFFGGLTPLLILRCFLFNGAAGLLFGRFYRKYGIQYAMLAHMLFHVVTRTIWAFI